MEERKFSSVISKSISVLLVIFISFSGLAIALNSNNPVPLVDLDSDGMPDDWEIDFGLNPSYYDDRFYDNDLDNLNNFQEYVFGTHPNDADTDGDGMQDDWEKFLDLDPLDDGNYTYTWNPVAASHYDVNSNGNIDNGATGDIDHDMLANIDEYNGQTHPKDRDSDNDGMADGWEVQYGYDPLDDGDFIWIWEPLNYDVNITDSIGNPVNGPLYDADSDYLINWLEYIYTLDPNNPDYDNDGLVDGFEIALKLNPRSDDNAVWDADGDGLNYLEEQEEGTNPTVEDTDGDGMPDGWEVQYGLNPLDDGNAVINGMVVPGKYNLTIMIDGIKLSAEFNYQINTSATPLFMNGKDGNPDNDGYDLDGDGFITGSNEILTNFEEYLNFSNPQNNDTDKDGMPDGFEIMFGLYAYFNDSMEANDYDTLTNIDEFLLGTYPNDSDTDNDGMPDDWEASKGLSPTDNGIDWARDSNRLITTPNPDNGADGDPDKEWEHNSENLTLTNIEEYQWGTNPVEWDSDMDKMDDAWEIKYGLDSFFKDDHCDQDSDFLTNYEEYIIGSNPTKQDTDDDGYSDLIDAFPLDEKYWLDSDGDEIPDELDLDNDNDGVPDTEDAFPFDPDETLDSDGDGIGDNADTDDDNDGVPDEQDDLPTNPDETVDTDGDGIGDNADLDDDNDGIDDIADDFPQDAEMSQSVWRTIFTVLISVYIFAITLTMMFRTTKHS